MYVSKWDAGHRYGSIISTGSSSSAAAWEFWSRSRRWPILRARPRQRCGHSNFFPRWRKCLSRPDDAGKCGFTYSLTDDLPSPLDSTLQSSAHSGQTGQATGFIGQSPSRPPNFRLSHPDVSARPDARGIPSPLWELFEVKLDYIGGDYARVCIVFKKRQDPMSM